MWKDFQRPKALACDEDTGQYGEFHAQPFERGFGTTIGNALRRVLLSSIEGAAVTAVKIDGVLHEFSPIRGVVEDATDIILNLKQVPIKLHSESVKTVTLSATGPGKLTAGDIRTDQDVEVLDKEIHIATVERGGSLNMELRIKRGRGYVSAERNLDEDLGIGWIPVDSVHSPIKKVNYVVEAARLGQTTDYDKLTLKVWTDGTVSARDAVSFGATLVKDHLDIFIDQDNQPAVGDDEAAEAAGNPAPAENEHLGKSVEELELSARSYNCLRNANIQTVRQLVVKTEAELLATKNFGQKSLSEIVDILATMGLELGMTLDEPAAAASA
ncbi:MAG: DNA-directed RNA polymerase subunit alpha [Acidobacteria bacterium]|nr:DNA-directed RNA polymerase subunit alpha [Acidobacteriota bacterium]